MPVGVKDLLETRDMPTTYGSALFRAPANVIERIKKEFRLPQEARGLRQFKSAFAPRRRPLYLAAPNRLLWWLAACDILLRIAKPDKIKR